jgi:hypothetical protein
MVNDTADGVGQPGLGIDAVQLCGLDQAVDGGGTVAALIRACKQPDGMTITWLAGAR